MYADSTSQRIQRAPVDLLSVHASANCFFGGHAALSSADRISNDGVRTRVRLCFARGRKPALKSPNDRRTIAKRVRQFKNDLMSIQKIDVNASFIVTNFIRCVCWNKFPKRL